MPGAGGSQKMSFDPLNDVQRPILEFFWGEDIRVTGERWEVLGTGLDTLD